MKYYAGIGSRQTPTTVLHLMSRIGAKLDSEGYILRSGGAKGADQAFAQSVKNKEVYLPWSGFENQSGIIGPSLPTWREAMKIAERLHPCWGRLSQGARKLMTGTIYQILGKDLSSPVKMVICWTPQGSGSGGTGQAIRLAKEYQIPVRDLGLPDVFSKASEWLSK